MEEINIRLRKLRKALGYTQEELAKILKVTSQAIGSWERGETAIPNVRVDQICTKLGASQKWLETGEGEMKDPNAALPDSPEEWARRQGWDALASSIFGRYLALPQDERKRFEETIRRLFAEGSAPTGHNEPDEASHA